jgi:dolichol-phosphate mannosyltransferase
MILTAIARAPEGPLTVQPLTEAPISLSVIVPAFQEAENIGLFLHALCKTLDPVLANSYEILVVDDNSPDGTLETAAETAASHAQIRLIKRQGKRELATAVIRGWQMAHGRVLATINADFQHPPELIAEMWKQIQDVDLVVASRYCKGGSLGDWTLPRRVLARGARGIGKCILPWVFNRVSDPLSGCYLFWRESIAGVELNPIGYKSLIEILARGNIQRIAEFPYTMHARERGSSKANLARLLEYVVQLCRLRKAWKRVHG